MNYKKGAVLIAILAIASVADTIRTIKKIKARGFVVAKAHDEGAEK